MTGVAAAFFLVGMLGQDWLPPGPEVLFTQVDKSGRELGDSYPAVCAGETCRATFPADFDPRACMVNAVVTLPVRTRSGTLIFSVSPCTPNTPNGEPLNLGQSFAFTLDGYGAASELVTLPSVGACRPGLQDLVRRACAEAQVCVDIVLWTAARR